MSGRSQTHTVASEGAELDDNYQKMVSDIEEQTQRSGWLFGRGAFDKGDLQYLRDFNNSLRYKEVEIEDKEKELWERERARVEAEATAEAAAHQSGALARRSSSGSVPGASTGLRGPPGPLSRPSPLLLPVKVKPAGSKQLVTPQSASSPAVVGPPSCKRARTAAAAATADGGALISPPSTGAALSALPVPTYELRSSQSETVAASPGLAGSTAAGFGVEVSQQAHEWQVTKPRSHSASDVPDMVTESSKHVLGNRRGNDGGAAAAGLATLLGGYDSEDEDEKEEGKDNERCSGGGYRGDGLGASSRGDGDDRDSVNGDKGGAEDRDDDPLQAVREGREGSDVKGGTTPPGSMGGASELSPPVALLSPEDLLLDPQVISDGLMATRPNPQDVHGGDAWDSEEAPSSDLEA